MEAACSVWTCPRCNESNDARFDACWNCGSSQAGERDPDFVSAVKVADTDLVCDVCGYYLYGLDRDRCPECGREFERRQYDTTQTQGGGVRLAPGTRLVFKVIATAVALLLLVLFIAAAIMMTGFGKAH